MLVKRKAGDKKQLLSDLSGSSVLALRLLPNLFVQYAALPELIRCRKSHSRLLDVVIFPVPGVRDKLACPPFRVNKVARSRTDKQNDWQLFGFGLLLPTVAFFI